MNRDLKKIFDLIRNNITMIAVIPTLIGGIWQICKLGSISINMIRFFSISQLVCDGMILLVIFIPLFLYLIPFIRTIYVESKKGQNIFDKDLLLPNLFAVMVLLSIIVCSILYFELYRYIKTDNLTNLFARTHLLFIPLVVLYYILQKILKKEIIMQFVFIAFAAIFFSVTLISFNNISQNLKNIENFQLLLQSTKEQTKSKKIKILYFNDKYIFIEIDKLKSKSILIKKIDNLFEV